jgi:hypothetical protein
MSLARDIADLGSSATSLDTVGSNLLINGAMVLDQRNSASAVTPSDGNYTLDRFHVDASAASKFSVQQVTDAPIGFSNSLKVTSLSAYSVSSSDFLDIQQPIEGFNSAQLNLGTANAKVMTLSFYVKSSLTGTFGGAFSNSAYNRSYPFTYTISAADTWERKTIKLTGDTSGTWIGSTNGIGLRVVWSVGAGSGRINTAGAWVGSLALGATGQTNVVATNAATWQMTGCQLEVNEVTDFEHEPYSVTLAKAQRYYERWDFPDSGDYTTVMMYNESTSLAIGALNCTVYKRSNPTFSATASSWVAVSTGSSGTVVSLTANNLEVWGCRLEITNSNTTLVDGGAAYLRSLNSGCHMALSAEL